VVAIALGMGACTSDYRQEYLAHTDRVTSGAGNAMAANRAVHTIDPWPYHSQNTHIDIDGKRIQGGARRYENNTSIKPKGLGSGSPGANGNANGDQKN
jgi:hypothetical protein